MKIKVSYIDTTETANVSFAKKYANYTRQSIEVMNKNAVKFHIQ